MESINLRHIIDNYRNFQPKYAKYSKKDAKQYSVVGLAAEAGEVLGVYQKALRKGEEIPTDRIKDELGDVLWYVMAILNAYNLSLSEVLEYNMEKLDKRNA